MKNIRVEPFTRCFAVEHIYVHENNTDYTDLNGVLYTHDLSKLISYPLGRREKYYIVPKETTSTGSYLFAYSYHLEWIMIRGNFKNVGSDLFLRMKVMKQFIYTGTTNPTGCVNFAVETENPISILTRHDYAGGTTFCKKPSTKGSATATCGTSCYHLHESKYSKVLYLYGSGATKDHANGEWLPNTNLIEFGIMENGFTGIGSRVFYHHYNLKYVEFPESAITMGSYVMEAATYVETVNIPKALQTMGTYGFYGCSHLRQFTVSEGNTHFKSVDGVLYSKDGKILYAYPNARPGESYDILHGTQTINNYCFYGANYLRFSTVPSTTSTIGNDPWTRCTKMERVDVNANNTSFKSIDGVLYDSGLTKLITYPIGNYSKYYISPTELTTIGHYAFTRCVHLEWILFRCNFVSISGTMNNMTNLQKVFYTGTAKITSDSASYFADCPKFKGVVVRNGYTGNFLNKVPTVTPASQKCGTNCYYITDVEVGKFVFVFGSGAMTDYQAYKVPWYSLRDQIEIGIVDEGITHLGSRTFYYHSIMNKLYLSTTIKSMGEYVFQSCSQLDHFVVPINLASMGDYSWYNCTKLKRFEVAENSKNYRVDNGILFSYDNKTLAAYPNGKTDTSYTIPSTCESIMNYAFYGNEYLTSVTIHPNVKTIGYDPWTRCHSITTLTVTSGNTNYVTVDGVLYTSDMKLLVAYPIGKTDTMYTIPSSVTILGNQTFIQQHYLVTLTIEGNLSEIRMSVLTMMNNLEKIIYKGTTSPVCSATKLTQNCPKFIGIQVPSGYTGQQFCDIEKEDLIIST